MKYSLIGWNEVKGLGIRPIGWVIIIFNIFWIYSLLRGLYDIGISGETEGAIGVAVTLFILLWLVVLIVVNVVLYIIFRITGNRRFCPACGFNVKVGLTVCSKCNFDFAKAAGN